MFHSCAGRSVFFFLGRVAGEGGKKNTQVFLLFSGDAVGKVQNIAVPVVGIRLINQTDQIIRGNIKILSQTDFNIIARVAASQFIGGYCIAGYGDCVAEFPLGNPAASPELCQTLSNHRRHSFLRAFQNARHLCRSAKPLRPEGPWAVPLHLSNDSMKSGMGQYEGWKSGGSRRVSSPPDHDMGKRPEPDGAHRKAIIQQTKKQLKKAWETAEKTALAGIGRSEQKRKAPVKNLLKIRQISLAVNARGAAADGGHHRRREGGRGLKNKPDFPGIAKAEESRRRERRAKFKVFSHNVYGQPHRK